MLFKAAGAGAIGGGTIGCVLTVEGGCFEGAIPGALTGLFGGAVEVTIEAVSSNISGYPASERSTSSGLGGMSTDSVTIGQIDRAQPVRANGAALPSGNEEPSRLNTAELAFIVSTA